MFVYINIYRDDIKCLCTCISKLMNVYLNCTMYTYLDCCNFNENMGGVGFVELYCGKLRKSLNFIKGFSLGIDIFCAFKIDGYFILI